MSLRENASPHAASVVALADSVCGLDEDCGRAIALFHCTQLILYPER